MCLAQAVSILIIYILSSTTLFHKKALTLSSCLRTNIHMTDDHHLRTLAKDIITGTIS